MSNVRKYIINCIQIVCNVVKKDRNQKTAVNFDLHTKYYYIFIKLNNLNMIR